MEDNKIFLDKNNSYNSELIYFKEEVLKDIKSLEEKLTSKFDFKVSEFKSRLAENEIKCNCVDNKLALVSALISEDKNLSQKLESLMCFKNSLEEKMLNQEIKSNLLAQELKSAVNKYDKLMTESVIYVGIIGQNCRFRNFHEFIDYVLSQMSQFGTFKDKGISDLKDFRNRMENMDKRISIEVEKTLKESRDYSDAVVKETERQAKDAMLLFDEKFTDFERKISRLST